MIDRAKFWFSGVAAGAVLAAVLIHFNLGFKTLAARSTDVVANARPIAAAAATVAPNNPATAESNILAHTWTSNLSGRQGSVDIAVYDNKTGGVIHYSITSGTFYTASIVKLSILEALLLEDQNAGVALTGNQLSEASLMIENSSDDAATELWDAVGGTTALDNLFYQLRTTSTTAGAGDFWGLTQTTALDQLKVVNAVAYPGAFLSTANADVADGLLSDVEPDQRWGVGAGVPAGVSVQLKDGWLPYTDGWIINSIGHVHGDGTDYTIAVLTTGNPSEQYGIDTIQSLASATWSVLAARQ